MSNQQALNAQQALRSARATQSDERKSGRLRRVRRPKSDPDEVLERTGVLQRSVATDSPEGTADPKRDRDGWHAWAQRTFGDDTDRVRVATTAAELALSTGASREAAIGAAHDAVWRLWATQLVGNNPARVGVAITAAKRAHDEGARPEQIEAAARTAAEGGLPSAAWQGWAVATFPDDDSKALAAASAALAAASSGSSPEAAAAAGRRAAETISAIRPADHQVERPRRVADLMEQRDPAADLALQTGLQGIDPGPASQAFGTRPLIVVAIAWIVFVLPLRLDSLGYISNGYGVAMSLWKIGDGFDPTVTHFPFWLLFCVATAVLVLCLIARVNQRRGVVIAAFGTALGLLTYSIVLLTGIYNETYAFHHYGLGFYVTLAAVLTMTLATGAAARQSSEWR